MAASMTLDMHNTDKLAAYRQELNRLGIPLLQPDINVSGAEFTVEGDTGDGQGPKAIRYALAAIKNVGAAAMAALVEDRTENGTYDTLAVLADRLDCHAVNKRQLENLVRAGALDGLNTNRRQLFEGMERILRHAQAAQHDRVSDQISLFGGAGSGPAPMEALPDTPDWSRMDRLREEFDAIGFYLSEHPLEAFGKSLERVGAQPIAGILAARQSGPVTLAGTVIAKRERTSSKGNRYAFVTCSDTSGVYEVTVFSEVLSAARDILEVGSSLLIKASIQFEGEGMRMTAHSVSGLAEATAGTSPGLKIRLGTPEPLSRIKEALASQGKGRGRVKLVCPLEAGDEVEVALPGGFAVSPSLLWAVQEIPGVLAAEEM
jgi:DNA polymerase-3 subunit alpha